MQVYSAFGLRFYSPHLSLPEFIQITSDTFDVEIQEGIVPSKMPQHYGEAINIHDGKIEMVLNAFIFRTHRFAHYFIEEGQRITFQKNSPDASIQGIKLFLYGICMDALLKQRNIALLHGSCILNEKYSIILFGKSGAGKSTTANYFLQQGYKTIGDDVLPIIEKNSVCYLIPAYPQSKLWKKSIDKLDIDKKYIKRRVRPDQDKFAIETKTKFHHEWVAPKCAIYLDWHNEEAPIFETIKPIKSVLIYQDNAYKRGLYKLKEHQILLYKTASLLAQQVPLYRFVRKRIKLETNLSLLKDLVENNLKW